MSLLNEINQIRNRMIKIGQVKGLSNQWTIAVSQELDSLIIQAQMRGIKA